MNRLPPYIVKLLKKSFFVRGTNVPVYRILDILATSDGDISKVVNYLPDVNEPELRQALHNCSALLRTLEQYVGSAGPTGLEKAPRLGVAPSPELETTHHLKIFIDASSLGNPGPAGIGYVFTNLDNTVLLEDGKYVGETTSNYAEALALKEVLTRALQLKKKRVDIFSDSELLVKQVNKQYKIKHPQLRKIHQEIDQIKAGFDHFSIGFVARSQNKRADKLASLAIQRYQEAQQG